MNRFALFIILALAHAAFADPAPSKYIACGEVTYEVAKLRSFGPSPGGLPEEQESLMENPLCDFWGVYQETWSATCFAKEALDKAKSGDAVAGLSMNGYEHGALYTSNTADLSCKILKL